MSLVVIIAVLWAVCLVGVLLVWAWSSTGGRADLDVRPEPAGPTSSPAPKVSM